MRKAIGVAIGGFALAGLLTLAPIPAEAGGSATLTVTKTVVGPGPTGPYAIEVTCTGGGGSATPSSFDLNDGESRLVEVNHDIRIDTTCTVVETETQDAAVSYACSTSSAAATCDDDQIVTFRASRDVRAQVDITNTFAPPAPAPAPAPVEAQPAFTG